MRPTLIYGKKYMMLHSKIPITRDSLKQMRFKHCPMINFICRCLMGLLSVLQEFSDNPVILKNSWIQISHLIFLSHIILTKKVT